jgi:hypothetical protein
MTDIQALVLGIRKECSWRKLAAGDTTVGSTPVRTSLPRWSRLIQAGDASGFRRPVAAARVPNLKDLANRVRISSDFDDDIRSLITPGTTLVITNLPVGTGTHSAPGFSILTD